MSGRVILAGGSGFIGTHLVATLKDRGYAPVLLSRKDGPGRLVWDGKNLGAWTEGLNGAAAVINLAGETITLPWNDANRVKIRESRTQTTRLIGTALAGLSEPPPVWVNASATGFYGDRGSESLDESSPSGPDGHFLVSVCKDWENSARETCPSGVRLALVRVGFVLGKGGGALPILSKLTKAFLGGAVGDGKQFVSWIHIQDLVNIFIHAIENPTPEVLNGTGPNPVTNAELMATLRKVSGRPWSPPAPKFAMKILQALGGPDASLVLEGQKVLPTATLESGFKFRFENLEAALGDLA